MKRILFFTILVLFRPCEVMATTVLLNSTALGLVPGNQGPSVNVSDLFTITASTTNFGEPVTANVWIGPKNGTGVVSSIPPIGQPALSASRIGLDNLHFDFADSIRVNSFLLGLYGFKVDRDSMTLILTASDGSQVNFDESHWLQAVVSQQKKNTIVDLGALVIGSGYGPDILIDNLTLSQSSGNIYVNSIDIAGSATPVPEPTTLALLGMGCLVFLRKKF